MLYEVITEPPTAPFLPGAGLDPATLPEAVPQKLVPVRNGDTLELTAGLVRRALQGRPVVMYAYNRQYPGPLIQANQGDILYVRFKNEIDLPSAVHWHGIRLENWSDGVPGGLGAVRTQTRPSSIRRSKVGMVSLKGGGELPLSGRY